MADHLDGLLVILGVPLLLSPAEHRAAAELAELHGLTFYDAAWAATARAWGIDLVSADRQLLAAGVAVLIGSAADRASLT